MRLNRAQQQARTRENVLTAARDEFAEHGFRDAKIDRIAERAELTRGAVYSNFPSKRALYFAVLTAFAEQEPRTARPDPGGTVADRLAAFARAWVSRLPLTHERHSDERLRTDLLAEVITEDRLRGPFGQLTTLGALLLGTALEAVGPARHRRTRRVPVAQAVLTTLHGADQLAAAAPGFADPFDVVQVCAHLASLDLADTWPPPHLPYVAPARPAADEWSPPEVTDLVRAAPAVIGDGVLAVLGLHRLEAAEEAVRGARAGDEVTVAVVPGGDGELGPLARLAISDLMGCLRQAFPSSSWPRLRVVLDERGVLAAAAGHPDAGLDTEAAVRVRGGQLVARAHGRGALHAAASAAG